MINLIQPITVQQAYDGITHARRWASWNWWWRMVDDDDGDESPSPEPRTDSRSALPRGFRAWRRLRIVKRDESFSLIFFSPNTNIWSWSWGRWSSRGPTRQGARPRGGAPHPRDRLFCSLEQGPSLLDYVRWENHVPEDFMPFDIPFLRNTEIGKKTAILGWASG